MNRSKITAMTVASLLSLSSWAAFAGNDAPVDKGGMPPYTEMNAVSGPENALPPGSIGGGNGGDANGSSTSAKKDSGSNRAKGSMDSGSGSGAAGTGSADAVGEKEAAANRRY